MPRNSMPLQTLQSCPTSQDTSTSSEPRRLSKRRSQTAVSGGLDTECTPSELIQHWSPNHKQQRLASKDDKENASNQFVLARRSRRRKESTAGVSWDFLPDELLLRILLYLPLQDLLRVSRVCRRWHCLAFDESLWCSVDLEGLTNMGPALEQVLKTKVQRLRCPRSSVEELCFSGQDLLQLVQLDLSNSIMPTSALESIICRCRLLERLSLEGLQLSDAIISALSKNPNLVELNLSGCSGFSASALAVMLQCCCSLEQLNISWCVFSSDHVKTVVNNLSPSITQLNLSGYREILNVDDVKVLVTKCPHLETLDLSDSTLLVADSFHILKQLRQLSHLSLSRCYHIHLAALNDVGWIFPSLGLLDVFGIVHDSQLPSLRKEMPHVSINSRPFSSIARPTPATRLPATRPDCTMWSRKCSLRFRL